ncbi:hypothetical protein ACIQKB_35985 [Streptomyces sp. NPDC092046]|uniref:hypothetical protein n=1 Tax=Streptomyces sp. NPDC092046 TaxID=3366009 RepID=UPI003820A05D
MPARAQRDPRRSPSTSPRAPSHTSPYSHPDALRPRNAAIELPVGHHAEVKRDPTATEFLGKYFSQDSLAFLLWLADFYWNDLTGLRVVLHCMGSQDVGGIVHLKQNEIAKALKLSEEEVSRAMSKARKLGLLYTIARGVHQLQPTVTLRGGVMFVEAPRGAVSKQVPVKVEQLSLLSELMVDQDVPEEFRNMAAVDAALPPAPARPAGARRRTASQSRKKPEE